MKTLLAALMVLVSACYAMAAETASYNRNTLRLPAQLMDLAAADLNGDGLSDIVAFTVSTAKGKAPARHVSVYYQKKNGGFSAEPDQTWPLDPEAAVFDVGDVSGGGRKAIAYLRRDGLCAYLPGAGGYATRPVFLVKYQTAFSQPDPLDMPRWPVFVEGGGRAADIALIPDINRLAVFTGEGGQYRAAGSIELTVRTSYSQGMGGVGTSGQLTATHKMPVIEAMGFNAPKGSDLFVTWDDNADVWTRKSAGFGERPMLRFRPGLLDTNEKDSLDSATVQAADLNGDGKKDLVVTKIAGGVAQSKTLVFIYLRGKDGSFPRKPNQTIITEGVLGPKLADVNADGRADILLPSIKMGIKNFINMLTSKQLHMDIGVYLQGADGRYPDQPTKEKGVNFKLDISRLGKNARPVMGIGRFSRTPGLGLALVTEEDRVSLYLPDRYSIFSDNPGITLKADTPTEMEVMDLDGDGIDDLILTYRKNPEKNRQINVFISK